MKTNDNSDGVNVSLRHITKDSHEEVDANHMQGVMNISAEVTDPVHLSPEFPRIGPPDVLIKCVVSACAGNNHGFPKGDWIPYLGIYYQLTKNDSEWSSFGCLKPIISDPPQVIGEPAQRPFYGINTKLEGVGRYTLEFRVDPPAYHGLYRQTGTTSSWWSPFYETFEFYYN